MKQLGDILLEGGLVTQAQLQAAYDEHQRAGRALGRVLVDQGVLTEAQLVAALAQQIGMRFVELADFPVDHSAVGLVSGAIARRYVVLPFGFEDGKLLLAMADPANFLAIEDVRAVTQMEVKPCVADPHRRAGRDRPLLPRGQRPRATSPPSSTSRRRRTSPRSARRSRTPRSSSTSTLLITQAIQDRASDIHIEPTERDLRVRYRIDGVLHEIMRSPEDASSPASSAASRSWRTSTSPSVASRRTAACRVNADGKKIDLRVATLPTVWGEKVVMRILDNSTARLDLDRPRASPTTTSSAYSTQLHQAVRDDPGDRARPVRASRRRSTRRSNILNARRGQHHHGRGPGRVPAARHQPGAGQHQGRPDLRRGAALDPALRPRHRPHR